jgi:hypothetical protein
MSKAKKTRIPRAIVEIPPQTIVESMTLLDAARKRVWAIDTLARDIPFAEPKTDIEAVGLARTAVRNAAQVAAKELKAIVAAEEAGRRLVRPLKHIDRMLRGLPDLQDGAHFALYEELVDAGRDGQYLGAKQNAPEAFLLALKRLRAWRREIDVRKAATVDQAAQQVETRAFIRSLALWWLRVVGRLPQITGETKGTRGDETLKFADFVQAAKKDQLPDAIISPRMTLTVLQEIRRERKQTVLIR